MDKVRKWFFEDEYEDFDDFDEEMEEDEEGEIKQVFLKKQNLHVQVKLSIN